MTDNVELNKAVQDVPSLRHSESSDRCCGCQFFRAMESGYCWKYDSKVQPDWVCESYMLAVVDADAAPLAVQEAAAEVVSSESSSGESSSELIVDLGAPVPFPEGGDMLLMAKADGANTTNNVDASEYSFYIPITKVDAVRHEVWGFGALEQPDAAKEILDYATSKPYFQRWSDAAQKRSGGKSLGNVRSMHSNIAAGKVVDFQPVDAQKGFYLGVKITNDAEWKQVEEGVYTGFSVGGRYVKRWPDSSTGMIRYTADPTEFSLVDAPCIPGAVFQLIKADGVEERPFVIKVDLPPTPSATQTTAEGVKVAKFPDPAVTLSMPLSGERQGPAGAPGADVIIAASNPRQQEINLAAPGVAKDSKQGAKTMDKRTPADAITSARGILSAAVEQAGPGASAAINQAMAVLDAAVSEADIEQDVSLPSEAAAAASTQSVAITDESPTQTETLKAGGVEPSSAPSTPSTMESESSAPGAAVKSTQGAINMSDQIPASTTPPGGAMFNVNMGEDSIVDERLPKVIAALDAGSLKRAQAACDGDEQLLQAVVRKAQKLILDQGGWKMSNLQKINSSPVTAYSPDDMLAKAISSTDLPNYYLIRLAKLMLPLYAGLRRRIPASTPPVGSTSAHWKAQLGNGTFDFATALAMTEGSPGVSVPTAFLDFAAPFKRIAVQDKVYLEALYSSRGFDDPLQVAVVRALTMLLGVEERKILGDNSGSIAAPGTITVTSSAGGSLTAGSYRVSVDALTYRGWLNITTNGATYAGSGGGVGETDPTTGVLNTGSSAKITATWAAVTGAVAYAVYISDGSTNCYVRTVTIGSTVITTCPSTGSSPNATNKSANSAGFEGIIPWCQYTTVYSNSITGKATITDQSGTSLSTYAGGISEFDDLLSSLWTTWQTAPSLILTSANGAKHLTKQLLSTSAVSAYRVEVGGERGTMAGGLFVAGYVNKFAPYADGTPRVIDVMPHPYCPDGAYYFLSENIPYPMARESRGFALETLIPYTYFPLAQTDIGYPFSMLASETLECFHPSAQTAIVNVNVGL